MNKLIRTATLSAILFAVLSVPMGFVSNAYAGGGPAALDLILAADCAFTHDLGNPAALPGATPPAPSVLGFNIQNDGTATATVGANIGNSTAPSTGGFQDDVDNNLSIFPTDVDIDAVNTAGDATGLIALNDDGTEAVFAQLEPLTSVNEGNNPRGVTLTVATDNLQNLPKSGTQSATITFTVACA